MGKNGEKKWTVSPRVGLSQSTVVMDGWTASMGRHFVKTYCFLTPALQLTIFEGRFYLNSAKKAKSFLFYSRKEKSFWENLSV